MKIKISDMMGHVGNVPVEIRERDIASAELIKEATMEKIHKASSQAHVVRRISKAGIVAAVMAAALSITVAAAAVIKWGGFAFTDGMTNAEKNALIEEVSQCNYSAYEDKNGNVHYLDENGEEVLVMSAREAAKYEREIQEAKRKAVCESTTLVDASTMPLIPRVITELSVDENGQFAECALGNGSMILLHPAEKDGFDLEAGDVVTIELTANDKCILEFGQFKDGVFVDAETVSAQQHSYTFVIEKAGLYCFYVEYYSVAASVFTDCAITIA